MPVPNYNATHNAPGIPVPVTLVGTDTRFLRVMEPFARALPRLFQTINGLQLQIAYRNLRKLRFVSFPESGGDAFYYDKSHDIISVYPLVPGVSGRLDKVFYGSLGRRYFERSLSSSARTQWNKKLVYPDRAVTDRLQKLFKETPRGSYKAYLRDFHGATEKLVVIHVINALIANSVKPNRLKTLDLRSFPATADFVNGRAPFSMKPLLSAYAGKQWGIDKYETAFGEYCARRGNFDISEPSVEDATLALFQTVTFNR